MLDRADETLLAAVDLARAALLEITPADTIGEPIGHLVEGEHVVSLLFECTMTGYPGWHWTVSLARVDDNSQPTVLETELMPGGDAVLAPEWVPWSDRLADYRTAQDLAAAEAEAVATAVDDDNDDNEDDELDEDTLDEDDFGDDGDDELDGIDFGEALAASELHPAEADEAEAESDHGAPEPPAEAPVGELVPKDEHDDEAN